MDKVDVAVMTAGLLFPEGPRWHDGRLWFSDMYAGEIWSVDPESGHRERVAAVAGRPSGLGWLPDGRLLAVSMSDRAILRFDPGGAAVHADLSSLVTGDLNDMVVDGLGRAWVGNFGKGYAEGGTPEPTNLIRVDPNGRPTVVAENLIFPNGMVITPDGGRLIVAEGFAQRLTQFEVEADGSLGNRSLFAELDAIPDGIALDAEGGVWVALPLAEEFVRVVEGGNVTDRISVAPSGAFACALGGPDRRTLFMCVTFGSREQIRNRQSKSEIRAARVAVAGAGWP